MENLEFMKKNILKVLDMSKDSKVLAVFKNNNETILKGLENINYKKLNTIAMIDEIETENDSYDYIILKLDDYLNENYIKILSNLRSKLEYAGKLIILATNCFGMKYFCGANYNSNTNIFDTITKKDIGIGKKKINSILDEVGYGNRRFFYPFPDYEYTSVVFSDKYIPNENMSKLMYNLCYLEGSRILFNEHDAIKNAIYNGEFENFANSFIIFAEKSNNSINNNLLGNNLKNNNPEKIKEEELRFVSFNNFRKEEYRIVTKMYGTYVRKYEMDELSKKHIERIKNNIDELNELSFNLLDKHTEKYIESRYENNNTLYQNVIKMFDEGNVKEAILSIKNWRNYIRENLSKAIVDANSNNTILDKFNIQISSEEKNKLTFVKYGLLDLVLENTFVIDNKYYFYDQEWNYINTPVEFIVYRALNNMYAYFSKLCKIISFEDMLKEFEIVEFKDTFKILESKVQDDLLDKDVANSVGEFYSHQYNILEREKDIESQNEYIKSLEKSISEKEKNIAEITEINNKLKNELENVNNELNNIKNSKTWKIINKFKG